MTRRALKKSAHLTAFAERPLRRRGVRAGDDRYGLMRLNGKFLTCLPGRGRQWFLTAVVIGPGTFPSDVDVAIVRPQQPRRPARYAGIARRRGLSPDRITVVDVASTDGTAEWLAREGQQSTCGA